VICAYHCYAVQHSVSRFKVLVRRMQLIELRLRQSLSHRLLWSVVAQVSWPRIHKTLRLAPRVPTICRS
jgi:hypothetical protein